MNRTLIIGLVIAVLALVAGGVVWAAGPKALAQAPNPQAQSVVEDQAAAAGKPGRLPDNIVHGTVVAVEEDEALINTGDGLSVTLIFTETTVQWVPGEPPTRTLELAVGDPVLAFGRPVTRENGEKALVAQIIVIAEDEDLPKYLIRGQVVVATRQTIVVNTGQRERAITVLPRTRFFSPDRPNAPRDVRPGDAVIALGQPTEIGQWIAGAVLVPGVGQLPGRGLTGKVTAVDLDAGTLTIQVGQRGTVTVVTDDETRYRIRGIEEPSLAAIKTGDRILATGRFEQGSQTRFLAKVIQVVVPPAEKE
ncbi:MAG: hypothetical protein JXM73_01805 [Anaerolineae bacterium]|nr:hypothetical protein [Anaerolineae bacterium]